MKNPDYLADVIKKGVEPHFEDLLYVSTKAFQNKTGKQKEAGKNWKAGELPTLYPELWSKFN